MGFFKGLRERAARIFNRPAAPEQSTGSGRGGWFQRRREAREERKRQREYEKSQRRQEKMDREREEYERKRDEAGKLKRMREERLKKEEDRRKKEEHYNKVRETFANNWAFSEPEYDKFVDFIDKFEEDMKEFVTSESLVEIFRSGYSYRLTPEEIKDIVIETYNNMYGGFTSQDLNDEIFEALKRYSENVEQGAYV